MCIKSVIVALLVGLVFCSCEKPRDKHVRIEIEAQELAKGNTVESFLITRHKEKSPNSHTFYYEAKVTDKAGQALTVKDSLWLYHRNDSSWIAVPHELRR